MSVIGIIAWVIGFAAAVCLIWTIAEWFNKMFRK